MFASFQLLHAGTHGPQPVPQDSDRTPQDTPTTAPPTSDAAKPPPTADSPRPSQPPADDMLSDAQALHPPSHPPSNLPSNPPKGLARDGQSQGEGQAQQRHTPHHRSGEDGGTRQLLRERVVHVTEAAAGLPGLASSKAECKKVFIPKLQERQISCFAFCPPCLPSNHPRLASPSCASPFSHSPSTCETLYAFMCCSCAKQRARRVPTSKLQGCRYNV